MTRLRGRLIPEDLASRAAGLSLFANFGLMVLKLVVGVLTGSVAVLSDGVDSFQDMIAAGIAFVSVRFGRRPADLGHPYGHGRAETLAAGIQALLISGGAAFIVYSGVHRLIHPHHSIQTVPALITMALTAVINFGISRYSAHVAKVTRSPAIASDARHLMTNVVQAIAILAGLALVEITGRVVFDALLALALAMYLFWIAGSILWTTAGDILDVSLSRAEIDLIEQAIEAEDSGIVGYHRLRTRRAGQVPHIDFHLLVRRDMSVADSHVVADRIEARIRQQWPAAEIMIHVEPDDAAYDGPLESNDPHSPRIERHQG